MFLNGKRKMSFGNIGREDQALIYTYIGPALTVDSMHEMEELKLDSTQHLEFFFSNLNIQSKIALQYK